MTDRYPDLLLPERARLFHIGIPKTGTTSVQRSANELRTELAEHGVHYPQGLGTAYNHRDAVMAALGRGWGGLPTPPMAVWADFRADVESAGDKRVWFGHELASEATDEQAGFFRSELGPDLHVVITLRHFAALLPSAWSEHVKLRSARRYDDWLHAVLDDPPDLTVTPTFHARNRQGELVRRWAKVLGPDHVTVIIVDKSDPDRLPRAFEGLLGLPAGLLDAQIEDNYEVNRSMSREEAELCRAVNEVVVPQMSSHEYLRLVRFGSALGMLREHSTAADTPIALPQWAAEAAAERSAVFAVQIAASGVRVVGDLDEFRAPYPAPTSDIDEVTAVPLDLAAQAVAGGVLKGMTIWREVYEHESHQIDRTRSRELLRIVWRRFTGGLRRRLGRAGARETGR